MVEGRERGWKIDSGWKLEGGRFDGGKREE